MMPFLTQATEFYSVTRVKQQHKAQLEAIFLVKKTSTSDLRVPVNVQFITPLRKSCLDSACKNWIV